LNICNEILAIKSIKTQEKTILKSVPARTFEHVSPFPVTWILSKQCLE